MICKRINIWDGNGYKGVTENNETPYMNTYILAGNKKRPAVLVLPGGGYQFVSEREAEPIAMKFAQAGYNAFVLYYSVAPNRHPQPLLDVSLAVSVIRKNSDEWNVMTDKIFVCGFSAGGHLAASLGVHWNKGYISEELGIKNGANMPNGLILCYPVICYGEKMHAGSFINLLGAGAGESIYEEMSLEKQVGKHTPSTFLWHTATDGAVPVDNSIMFAQALNEKGIPFELHIYPEGGHGLSLANEETSDTEEQMNAHVAGWMDLCLKWVEIIVKN